MKMIGLEIGMSPKKRRTTPPAETGQTSVTHNGVTWSFYDAATGGNPKLVQVYTGAEGQPYVVADPTTYVETDKPSSQVAGTFTGGRANSNGSVTTGTFNTTFWKNGMMKNPFLFDGNYLSASGLGQAFDELLAYYQTGAGPGSAACSWWDSTKNVDPGATGSRVQLVEGSYVKAVREAGLAVPQVSGEWRILEDSGPLSVLHVGPSAPPSGFFCPSACSLTKTPWLTVSMLDKSVLGAGFTLPAGKPNLATATGYFPSPLQPYFGQNGEKRRRMMNVPGVTNGYSRDYGQLWNDWFTAALLQPGAAGASNADFYKAIGFAVQLIGLYDRGFVQRGGAGQNAGHKQFLMLLALAGRDVSGLQAKCLAYEGNATHQHFWPASGDVGKATNYPDTNHDIYFRPFTDADVGRPTWFLGNEAIPPTIGVDDDAEFDTDYELTAGIANFGEMNNILALTAGGGASDGGTLLLQGGAFNTTNPHAASIAYHDRYRTAPANYNTAPHTSREQAYYDARRTASAVAKWTGTPDSGTPWKNLANYLTAGNGEFSWDLSALGFATQAITAYDIDYSHDGIHWIDVDTNAATGTQTDLIPGKAYYVRWRRQSAAGWGPWTVNFPHVVGENERCKITLTGSTATAASNVTLPVLYRKTYPLWLGPMYIAADGTSLATGDVLYCGVGEWAGNIGSFTYQWKRDGVNISGATNVSYTLQAADAGKVITCTVTNTASATSNGVAVPAATYPAFTLVEFDGTNDYLARTAAFTDAPADSQQFTYAIDIRMPTGSDGVLKRLVAWGDAAGTATTDNTVQIDRLANNTVQIILRQGTTTVFSGTTTGTLTAADGRVRLAISINIATSAYHCYKNDTSMTVGSITNTGAAFGLASVVRPRFMASLSATAIVPASVAYIYADDSYIDLSVQGNRDRFLTANIGNTGEGVTGSSPLVMLYGAPDDWNAGTNFGTGGNFTMTGAVVTYIPAPVLTLGSTTPNPPDYTYSINALIGDTIELHWWYSSAPGTVTVETAVFDTEPLDDVGDIGVVSFPIWDGGLTEGQTVNWYWVIVRNPGTADEIRSANSNTLSAAIAVTSLPIPQGTSAALFLRANDLTKMFQTITATTPVAADGDVVGTWQDQTSNVFDLTAAANDTTRPTYRAGGGNPYVEFDGTNDLLRRLSNMALWSASGYSACIAFRSATNAANRTLFGLGSTASTNQVLVPVHAVTSNADNACPWYRNDAGTDVISAATAASAGAFDETDNVLTIIDNGSSVQFYLDGVAGTIRNYTRGTNVITTNNFSLGGLLRTTPGLWLASRIHGLAIWPGIQLDATDRAAALTYFASLQGRTL